MMQLPFLPPHGVDVPSDVTLKSTIEQIARQCVMNPALEEVLRSASAGNKHTVLLKGKEFVVDPTHEGHQYFRWCVELAKRQAQPQQQLQPGAALISGVPSQPPVISHGLVQEPSSQGFQLPLEYNLPHLVGPSTSLPFSSPTCPTIPLHSQYDMTLLVNELKEPSPPNDNDIPILTATTASKQSVMTGN